MPNYELVDLVSRAASALKTHSDLVEQSHTAYADRTSFRRSHGIKVLAFCGFGRTGKDTAAEWWCKTAGLTYCGSASKMILPVIATMVGDDPDAVFAARHEQHEFWRLACHAIREHDLTLLVRLCLGSGDVWVGPRCGKELFEARRLGMYDYSYWVKRPVRPDPTVEYGEEDCDAVLLNNASVHSLYERIERLYQFAGGSFKQGVA